jgi:hypothetical protein
MITELVVETVDRDCGHSSGGNLSEKESLTDLSSPTGGQGATKKAGLFQTGFKTNA